VGSILFSRLLSPLLVAACAAPAGAQCLEWSAFDGFDAELPTWPPVHLTTWVSSILGFDDGNGPALYVAGQFTGYDGLTSSGVVRWDGEKWSALDPGPERSVGALIRFDDGTGTGPALFALVTDYGNGARDVQRWDGVAWTSLHFAVPGGGEPKTLLVFDDGSGPGLYALGQVWARWNGSTWTPVASFLPGYRNLTAHDDGTGQAFYFTISDSIGSNDRVARVTATGHEFLGGHLDNIVWDLASFDDGTGAGPELFAAGMFKNELTVPGVRPLRFLAKWDGTSWSQVPGVPDRHIRSLHVHDDGNGPALYAGGRFEATGAGPAAHIARWDGTSWSTLAGGPGLSLGTNFRVNLMASYDMGFGPTLWAGGDQAGGIPSFERLASFGSCFATFCDGLDGALAACPCPNPGGPDSGCDTAQQTGGVKLDVIARTTDPSNRATMTGTGFANSTLPTFLIRASAPEASPVVFGDGLRCLGLPVVRLSANAAVGGSTVHTLGHGEGAGAGRAYYQLWFRNHPAAYCDPLSAFNLSNGVSIDWR